MPIPIIKTAVTLNITIPILKPIAVETQVEEAQLRRLKSPFKEVNSPIIRFDTQRADTCQKCSAKSRRLVENEARL